MTLHLLQSGDGEYAELMRVQQTRLDRWAESHGARVLRVWGRQRPEAPPRAGYWEKPWVLWHTLERLPVGDVVFFMEPDVLLANLDADPLSALGEADMAMTWRTDLSPAGPTRRHFCTGVQILRVCEGVRDLYRRLWILGPQDHIFVGDCRPWNMLLCSQEYWPDHVTAEEASAIVAIRWGLNLRALGMEWNLHTTPTMPRDERISTATCIHWSRTPKTVVRRRMAEWIKRLETRS